ncbi:GNAT family N-acetyltransferase [Sulfitobacter sp. JB4-11]|uniref:GNAT family N-acetyltransferase n=1 Tax=Sulfitobacter rhodophyticola TaxID=3238304 RepID=UPI0035162309
MKHHLELFEQPIPTLRAPEGRDEEGIIALVKGTSSQAIRRVHSSLVANRFSPETSVVAELDGTLVGWALAYVLPFDPETLFIWKVEISEGAGDAGLASLMLGHLMRQDACRGITRVQTSIRSDDEDSWSLFRRFASWQRSRMQIQPFVTQALFPQKRHKNENLVTIELAAEVARAA